MAPSILPRTFENLPISPLATNLIVALLSLIIAILVATTTLLILRRYRQAQKLTARYFDDHEPPAFMPSDTNSEDDKDAGYEKTNEIPTSTPQSTQEKSTTSKLPNKKHHRRTNSTIEIAFMSDERTEARPSISSFVYESRVDLIRNSYDQSCEGVRCADVPELRITFPDEVDEEGVCRGGRVVVVRVGEKGYGLEPLDSGELQMMDTGNILREK